MATEIIVSLDFDTEREAISLVDRLGPSAASYKIGLQMLASAGPQLVRTLVDSGKQVFLDLKLHEIPNSVAGAVRAAGNLGASLVTVHASAGSAVLKAAVQAAKPFPQLRVLGLTVITSLAEADLPEVGLAPSVEQQVRRLAALAAASGCHGVVASVQEAFFLRTLLPPEALIVCPGIQLPESSKTDQARVATPAAAVHAGATHIVVGRAISAAASPLEAYLAVLEGMAA